MPELPEVETICRSLHQVICDKPVNQIIEIRNQTVKTNYEITYPFAIKSVYRKAKYIILETNQSFIILIHLRMTGKLIYPSNKTNLSKYSRAYFEFTDNSIMIFDDIRCFGTIEILANNQLETRFKKYGIEPFSKDFNKKQLKKISANKTVSIKQFLLDQNIIVGIGNIYAQEILFQSKISPIRPVKDIKLKEWDLIVNNTLKILEEAISKNGTSISDFRRIDNKTGEFQDFLKVYSKQICPECHKPLILIKQGGRSTRYCKYCQK